MGELADAFDANNAAIARVSGGDAVELAKVIAKARDELRAKLGTLESGRYTSARAHAIYLQLERASRELGARMSRSLADDLASRLEDAGSTALRRFRGIVSAGGREFLGSVAPLQIDTATILARNERILIPRFERSAARYGVRVTNEIRRQLMTGILSGESVDQMTSRVLRGTGMVRRLIKSGDIPKQLDAIADRPFSEARAWARRIVRTETVNAYNQVALDGIREANVDDPGYMKKWDAAHDRRLCPICLDLDGETVGVDAVFSDGEPHPPDHPHCRCSVVAWRREWKL